MPTDPVTPEPDIFDLQTSSTTDPRVRRVKMAEPDDLPKGMITVSSTEQMVEIFNRIIGDAMPDAEKIAEYKANGNRYRVEEGTFSHSAVVGQQHPHMFAWAVQQSLEKSNEGTFLATISREQFNGVWVPTMKGIKLGRVPRRNGTKVVKNAGLPPGTLTLQVDGVFQELTESIEVATEVLLYRIVWTDAAGNRDIKYDAKGQPIVDSNVTVHQTTDPNLIAILQQQLAMSEMMIAQMKASQKGEPVAVEPTATAPLAALVESKPANEKKSGKSTTE